MLPSNWNSQITMHACLPSIQLEYAPLRCLCCDPVFPCFSLSLVQSCCEYSCELHRLLSSLRPCQQHLRWMRSYMSCGSTLLGSTVGGGTTSSPTSRHCGLMQIASCQTGDNERFILALLSCRTANTHNLILVQNFSSPFIKLRSLWHTRYIGKSQQGCYQHLFWLAGE